LAIPRRLVEAVEITESQIHLIRLKGIFDASTVNEFEKVVSYLLARNFFCMVVDLSYVEFISSAGWGAFTAELRRVRENDGDIKLSGMRSDLFDVFLLLELDRFISAYESEDEAIMAFLQPPPEPVVETPFELPSSLRENVDALPNEETAETKLPAVYGAASSAIMAPANEDAMEYREKYGDDKEAFASDSQASEFKPYTEDGWTRQENFNADDTLEMASEQRRLGRGAEMRELLLTSGRATVDYSNSRRSLPPPALTAASDNLNHSGVAKSSMPRYDMDDTGGAAEFEFKAERDFAIQRPKRFSWQEADAFSELSLDLENHLQTHDRRTEANDDFTAFENFHTEKQYEPPTHRHNNDAEATQQFNTIIFSPDEALAENGADDDTTFGTEYSATADLKEDLPSTAPIFNNDYAGEDFNAARFSNNLPGFNPGVRVSGKSLTPEHDDDFEAQDIRDPWILEEIDTLPEEYEIDEAAAVYDDRPIATSEFSACDFSGDPEPPPAPENQPGHDETASEIEKESEVQALPETQFANAIAAPPEEANAPPNLARPEDGSVAATAVDNRNDNDGQNVSAIVSLPETSEANGNEEPLHAPANTVETGKIPMSGDLAEMIRGIIAAYPHFGPTMIGKFLEECVEPPVYLSRSTIYRYLREANLSTRRQRLEYSGEGFDVSTEVTQES